MTKEDESEEHKDLRKEIQEKLDKHGIGFRHSHGKNSDEGGPALYIADPSYQNNTKNGCQVSQPDIFIEHENGIDIIEIEKIDKEKRGKSPKYILGDIFSVHKSKFYRDKNGEPALFEGVCRLYVILTKNKPTKGKKNEQYKHLVESVNYDNGTLNETYILWEDEKDFMIDKISNNQKI